MQETSNAQGRLQETSIAQSQERETSGAQALHAKDFYLYAKINRFVLIPDKKLVV